MSRDEAPVSPSELIHGLANRSQDSLLLFCGMALSIAKDYLAKQFPYVPFTEIEPEIVKEIERVFRDFEQLLAKCEEAGYSKPLDFVFGRLCSGIRFKVLDYLEWRRSRPESLEIRVEPSWPNRLFEEAESEKLAFQNACLQRAIGKLGGRKRLLVVRYLECGGALDYDDLAVELGTKPRTLAAQFSQAIKQLSKDEELGFYFGERHDQT